jgi:hypothetical protein
MSGLAIVLLILAIALFGLGAVIEGALWLLAVGAIVLVVAIAVGIGLFRKHT